MDDLEAGKERPGAAERAQASGAAASGRGGRMWRQRKTAAVMRLLRGEDLETVSRSLGVTAATLTMWCGAFVSAGEAARAARPDSGEALENDRLKARLGEVMIERERLHEKIAVLEAGRPLALRRCRP
jgi:hypothetical protein